LTLAQAYARAASVLGDEFDAGKREGFTDNLDRVRPQPPKALRPAARAVIDTQDLNDISLQSIRDDEGRLGDDEPTLARRRCCLAHVRQGRDLGAPSADFPVITVRCSA